MRYTLLTAVVLMLAGAAQPVLTQDVFQSTQSANLPTTAMLPRRGNFLFEISHRFQPAISSGSESLWGLDGGVFNRLGLWWQGTDRLLIGIVRANLADNLELNAKVALGEADLEAARLEFAAAGGIAWNTQLADISDPAAGVDQEDNESQAYAQLIGNARIGERVAVGIVPTYLRNPRVRSDESDNAFSLGVNGQFYLTDEISVLGEWIFSEERPTLDNDSGTFGIEFATRGHFFKVLVTNQTRMNPTQFLAGTPLPFDADQLRLGFNIQRVLPF